MSVSLDRGLGYSKSLCHGIGVWAIVRVCVMGSGSGP